MLPVSVLFFLAGIYLETLYAVPLRGLILPFIISVALPPLLWRKRTHWALFFILAGFCLAGMLRISPVVTAEKSALPSEQMVLYTGVVAESSPQTKILRISEPEWLGGARIVLRSRESMAVGDRVKVFGRILEIVPAGGNPGTTSWKWLKRIEGVNYEIKGTAMTVSPAGSLLETLRQALRRKVDRSGAQEQAMIMALTIGDRQGVSPNVSELFLRTGTSHILAVSGLQVAIITGFIFFLFRWLLRRRAVLRLSGRDRRYAALLTIPFPFFFMVMSGSGYSVIRATIMITVFMVSMVLERGRHPVNTISASGLIILILYPHSLFIPSFQLSFVSVLFIVVAMEKMYPYLREWGRALKWLSTSVLTTVSATLGTLPIVIYHFYGFNPLSLLHNLISVPILCTIATPLCFAGIVLPFGEYLLILAGWIVRLNVNLLKWLDFGYIFPIVRPDLVEIILFYVLALVVLNAGRKCVRAALYFILIPFTAFYVSWAFAERFHDRLCVDLIDVGLGDAILIEAPGGKRLLVDGGGSLKGDYDVGKAVIAPVLLSKKIRTLDYVVSTHPHADHLGGLPYILSHFRVGRLAVGGYYPEERKSLELLKSARDRAIPVEVWGKDDRFHVAPGVDIEVLNPPGVAAVDDLNDASLVMRLCFGKHAFLLTGDIGSGVEERLVLSDPSIRANLLKVPHHGSRHSSSPAFIDAVRPDVAVMSVGPGIVGLPSEKTLKTYEEFSIPVLRTDRNGFIRVCSDGRNLTCQVNRDGR